MPDSNFSMPPFFKTASATNWSFPHKKASLMNVILWSRGLEGDWEVVGFFNSKISFAVVNGSRVKFWKDRCCSKEPLYVTFPLLFALFYSKEAWVADFWEQRGEGGNWNFHFVRNLNDWEVVVMERI